ncbi:MAG TPA: hypothetical protein PKD04_04670 [Rhodocyclaceae bacterium]|nr:permease [Betaproteobacteria bacterium]HMV00352.1 hypothetical protein [Rhodocyclaceae bacterium]HMV20344.1 hypothetical protein [Rhodocyclaceae bacterium]HNE42562.1 hypothetical protein [Rhodocyclaceae bacterium]HNM21816.1 hypothetical protein [Rhodocyclaceae bacterium]
MKTDRFLRGLAWAMPFCLAACNTPPAPPAPPLEAVAQRATDGGSSAGGVMPLLAYYQLVNRMSAQELAREKSALAASPASPAIQVRMAMLLGQSRSAADIGRAANLLESVLRSADPAAADYHALARFLADHYGERQRLELQADRAAQLAKDSQRRAVELQDKLDALADIERSLPVRSRGPRQAPGDGR